MTSSIDTLRVAAGGGLRKLPTASRDVIILSTHSSPASKRRVSPPRTLVLSEASEQLLLETTRVLRPQGLLWVYGTPEVLAVWGERLARMAGEGWRMVFKYWFAIDLDAAARAETLKPVHQGLLLFVKGGIARKRLVARLDLDVDAARTPHLNCAACGRTLKDWGGKLHLMNPKGAAPADVWRDLPRRRLKDHIIPKDVLGRVVAMSLGAGRTGLHIIQNRGPATVARAANSKSGESLGSHDSSPAAIAADAVYHGDCVSFLERIARACPQGRFDLAFADPPYNLAKAYGAYDDERAEQQYLAWCNEWLAGMARALKPGGSLLVLNLPKWALQHATFLNGLLEFRHWIVWDALSDPRGKIMPAHYALLWFTKPGGAVKCRHTPPDELPIGNPDWVAPPEAPQFCLRAACVRERKARGQDQRVELTDIWSDVHRIKHQRDRDAHPCQLPDKLMERIIRLTTAPGDWVFDPFGGAGTTAIAAMRLGRRFVITEMDENYVRMAREKLAAMREHADLFGELLVPRVASPKPKKSASKREVETYLQALARRLQRMPAEPDVAADNPAMLAKIDQLYPYRAAAFKRAKLGLADKV